MINVTFIAYMNIIFVAIFFINPAGQQNAETDDDDISCTPWIIAFSIAMVIIIIFVIATIRPW